MKVFYFQDGKTILSKFLSFLSFLPKDVTSDLLKSLNILKMPDISVHRLYSCLDWPGEGRVHYGIAWNN